MAVTAFWFGRAILNAFGSDVGGGSPNVDILSDNLYVSLHTNLMSPDQDTWEFEDDLTNEVANGNGYTTGGQLLANKSASYTGATNTMMFDADDSVWASSTITARYAVIRDTTPGSAATNPLLGYIDFGEDVSSVNGPFTITWNAAGIGQVVNS